MPRPDIARYQEGDRVEDGRGNAGYVRQLKSRRTGRPYLTVCITEGPKKDTFVFPEKFGPPAIHWTENGPLTQCADCERHFRGGADNHGLRHIFCVSCSRQHDETERRMAVDASPSHGFGQKGRTRDYSFDESPF